MDAHWLLHSWVAEPKAACVLSSGRHPSGGLHRPDFGCAQVLYVLCALQPGHLKGP
jgi:hypothetical protein